jgi:hypothetical protein
MEQLFGALSDVLTGLGPSSETDEALAFIAWGRCSGEQLKERTKPVSFFQKRLVVAVKDLTWRRNLEELSPQLVAKLNAVLGDGRVRFIEFRIDPSALQEPRKKPADARDRGEVSPSISAAAESISDEALRERFLDAASSCIVPNN